MQLVPTMPPSGRWSHGGTGTLREEYNAHEFEYYRLRRLTLVTAGQAAFKAREAFGISA